MLAFVDIGDEVIALEPFYDSYRATIAMARGRCVPVRLDPPDFRLDEERLRDAVTDRTRRSILLNSPHNPTGAVLSPRRAGQPWPGSPTEHDLIVVTDEVYEHLAFDEPHVPFATLPGMAERTLTISSAGKTFSFTGWKIGWVTGPGSPGRRGAHDQAVPDLRQRRTVPVRRGARARHEMAWVEGLARVDGRRAATC